MKEELRRCFLLMLHIEIRYGNNGKAIPRQFGREKLFLLRDVLAQISLNPQQCGLVSITVTMGWEVFHEDDFLGALLVMNDTSKPLKEDSSDRALLPPSCLRAASEGITMFASMASEFMSFWKDIYTDPIELFTYVNF
ncbi:hypothetical protein MJT46_012189 [Ovis ammon polii x Ovis aries]|nr:hypothetical protein MJT46_012189 [Ovis ammon polii x Ovis aries]